MRRKGKSWTLHLVTSRKIKRKTPTRTRILYNNDTTMNLSEFLKEVNGNESDIINYKWNEALLKVKESWYSLTYVKDQTIEICLEAVKESGHSLQYVKDQTIEICLEAVKENGHSLRYVKDQTIEICLEAVKQDWHSLQYVKDQTIEICLEAVKQDWYCLMYVNKGIFKEEVLKEYTFEQLQEKLGETFKLIK